jgi:phosphoribosylformylglycinamidine synthase subunit PurL
LTAAHDLSDGGLLVGRAEMAMAGKLGAVLDAPPPDRPPHGYWFGEDQARYVVTAKPEVATTLAARAAASGVPMRRIGTVGGDTLAISGERPILVEALTKRFEGWLPSYMSGGAP